ncbi:MAG: hypothetical protein APF80_06030 [Alphaproteobacteria bacterium BRH_c36]|nr:MAG: hypothetical protein APF80_06030 [Alphaproteobacteria bacterium BRH_c36]
MVRFDWGRAPRVLGCQMRVLIGVLNRGQRTVGTDTLPDQIMPFTRLERRDRFMEAMASHDMLHRTGQRISGSPMPRAGGCVPDATLVLLRCS